MVSKTLSIPKGNRFTYYYPRTSISQTVPTKCASPKDGKLRYKEPAKFVAVNFKEAKNVPFGSAGLLLTHSEISRAHVVRAAMECGYGREDLWTANLAMAPNEAAHLKKYLLTRLDIVTKCVKLQTNGAWGMRQFYRHIEASEKAALSFILGGFGAYLAARQWLMAGSDNVKFFLHTGLYTKASVNPVDSTPHGS